MIDRRRFLLTSGSVIAACVAASLRAAALAAETPAADATTARLRALFDVFMDERLTKNPEQLSSLGLDKGKYAWAKEKLTEASLEGLHQLKQQSASQLERLNAFGRSALAGRDLADCDAVAYQLQTIARTAPFEYGDVRGYLVPYVVSPLTGAYQSVPTFLDREHRSA